MAYQICDPFDSYGNNFGLTASYPWTNVTGSPTVINTDSRFPSPAAGIPVGCLSVNPSNYARGNLVGTPSSLIVPVGVKFIGLPTSSPNDFLTFWDSGKFQVSLAVTSNGGLQFYRGNGLAPGSGGQALNAAIGTLTPNGTVVPGTWYGMLIQVTFNGSSGSVQLNLNGSSSAVINSSSLNTAPTTNAYATQVGLGNTANAGFAVVRYDDFLCLDTTGAFLNTPPTNDTRLIQKLPTQAGFYTNWTPTGLAANWQNAAVAPPNTSDYNANNTGGTKDSYTPPTAGLTTNPLMVMARGSLYRDDAGPHTPSLMVRSGSTDGVGSALPPITSSPLYYDTVFQNDPNTSSAWTGANADAAQVGVVEG